MTREEKAKELGLDPKGVVGTLWASELTGIHLRTLQRQLQKETGLFTYRSTNQGIKTNYAISVESICKYLLLSNMGG